MKSAFQKGHSGVVMWRRGDQRTSRGAGAREEAVTTIQEGSTGVGKEYGAYWVNLSSMERTG